MPGDPSIAAGTTVQFTATARFSDNTTEEVATEIAWTSSATAVATIHDGVATGLAIGTSAISATFSGQTATTTLTVTNAQLVSIAVTPPDRSVAQGTTVQYTATGVFTDHTTQDLTDQVVWTSSVAAFATMSNATGSRGLALAESVGTATIAASLGAITGSTTLTITDATLVAIDVTPIDAVMPSGTAQPFTAIGTYSDGRARDLTPEVTWTATAGATVSNAPGSNGVVTAQAASGTVSITATDAATGISGAVTVTLDAAVLTSIAVQPDPVTMAKGTTVQFVAEYRFSDGHIVSTTDATWSSDSADLELSNSSESRGLAQALADAGTATVRATDPASGMFGEAAVTLTTAVLVSIVVDPPNQTLPRSTTENYVATGIYSDFTTQDLTGAVTWSSSNTDVATVSNAAGAQGTLTTLSPGTTTIGASDLATGIHGETTLTVTNTMLASITITPVTPTIAKGARLQFVATGHYQDGSARNLTQFVSWASSSPNLAGVSNAPKRRGVATGKSAGTTTITATDPATLISGSTVLSISTATLQSITLTPSTSTIPSKTKEYFTATGNFSDGSSSDLTAAVSWSSSNQEIATISNQTFNNGTATSVSPGTTTITAFESTSGLAATATLTVSSATLVAIAVTPAVPSIIQATALPMIATGRFSDGSTKDITRETTWTSGNTAIATVLNVGSAKGTVTGVAVGTTSITANYPQTVIAGSTTVTIIP